MSACYGVEGGHVSNSGREASVWWHGISALHAEEWFHGNVCRSLGDGKNTLFWTDVWVGGVSFSVIFNRLYDLSLLKSESVFDMNVLGWRLEGAAWRWRRRIFAWEEELAGELRLLLQSITLQVDRVGKRLWRLETSSVYTVRSAYKFLSDNVPVDDAVSMLNLWLKEVPLKVVLFSWRLLLDRLPAKDNLYRQNVIGIEDHLCVGVCGEVETSAHLLLHCNIFWDVWNHIFRWIGVATVMPYDAPSLFNQFNFIGGAAKLRRFILQVIWFATVWKI